MDIQVTQILFQIINFGVVFVALTYLLYKPILKIFDERAKRIEEGEKAAQEAIESKANIEEFKKQVKNDLKKERLSALKKAQEEAKQQSDRIIEQARKQAQEEIAKLKQNWEKERAQLVKSLQEELVDSIIATTQKVTHQLLDAKSHKKLIDTELKATLKKLEA